MRIRRGIVRSGAVGPFSPSQLFASGEIGAWYDPSDLTTLFQDTAGTTPVTAAGQSVALMRDKSGRGNHATQATAAQRPIYQIDGGGRPHLVFDGVDDGMLTSTVTPGGVDKAQVFVGLQRAAGIVTGTVVELSTSFFGNNGSLAIYANTGSYEFYGNGTAPGGLNAATAAPTTDVLSVALDISGAALTDEIRPRIDGVVPSTTAVIAGPLGTGNFLAYPLYIGRSGVNTFPFNGNLYSLIVRFSAANLGAGIISSTETWVNGKTGAY